jgi:LysR family transcriptional regulator, hydrogen peroxide-inducible genes activator
MDVTIKQLKYLISLVDAGHFGRAAAAANVSQPALSMQIKALETALGTQLVERRVREVAVTPAGREVLRRARRIMEEIRELEEVARRGTGLGGRLRVGVIPTVAPYLLPNALPMLRARNLGLDLRVREAQTRELVEALVQGALDAAVVALPAPAPELVAEPLFEDRFLLVGSARSLAEAGGLRPEAMEPERLLLLDDGHCLADQTLAACALSREATRVDMRASSLATLCRLAEAGFGLTLVPELALRVELAAAPGLRPGRFAAPEPARTIGLVRRRTAAGEGWFAELAGLLAEAGRREIALGRTLAARFAADKPAEASYMEAEEVP